MTGTFCPPDCSGCQCPNGHPPCSHCVHGHDDTVEDRMGNMHIDWSALSIGDYISIDGVELVIMTRSDYIHEDGIKVNSPKLFDGCATYAVLADCVFEAALHSIRVRSGWYDKNPHKRPHRNGTTPDLIIMDDIHDDHIDPDGSPAGFFESTRNDEILRSLVHRDKRRSDGHALSLAVGRLGRTLDLHTELRSGVDPYSRD